MVLRVEQNGWDIPARHLGVTSQSQPITVANLPFFFEIQAHLPHFFAFSCKKNAKPPQKTHKIAPVALSHKKTAKCRKRLLSGFFSWDTRARTKNNRTRICCVANYTISQFSSSNLRKSTPLSELRCKGTAFFRHCKIKTHFFSPNPHFFSHLIFKLTQTSRLKMIDYRFQADGGSDCIAERLNVVM